MPFKIFKCLFPKSRLELLCTTKNNSVTLKSYNNPSIEQLGICSVNLKHKNKTVRCRFFIVPGDGGSTVGDARYQAVGIT